MTTRSLPALALAATLGLTASLAGAAHGNHGAADASRVPACLDAGALPSPHCGRVPTPEFDRAGTLWVVFAQQGHVYLARSADRGAHFDPPRAVNPTPERLYTDGENRPKIALGHDGEIYLSWTRKIDGRYAGEVRFARSLDGGASFSPPITVNDDRSPISHRFDALIVDAAGRITVAWIDKRDQAAARQEYAGAAIYTAVSTDRGASFAPNRKLADHSCECCRVALATDAHRPPLALWRHVYPVNVRDHAIARLDPSVAPTPTPMRATDDGWVIEGCPHHGPALSVDDHGQAHMAWFTGGGSRPGLHYGRIDPTTGARSPTHRISGQAGASRPQVHALPGGRVIVAWKALQAQRTVLLARRSTDGGEHWSAAQVLAATADASDHPQLISGGDTAWVGWHTQNEGFRLIPVEAAP